VLDTIGDQKGMNKKKLTFTATATDADLPIQALTYSLAGAPADAAIDPVELVNLAGSRLKPKALVSTRLMCA
jgi:hypothetical protein